MQIEKETIESELISMIREIESLCNQYSDDPDMSTVVAEERAMAEQHKRAIIALQMFTDSQINLLFNHPLVNGAGSFSNYIAKVQNGRIQRNSCLPVF